MSVSDNDALETASLAKQGHQSLDVGDTLCISHNKRLVAFMDSKHAVVKVHKNLQITDNAKLKTVGALVEGVGFNNRFNLMDLIIESNPVLSHADVCRLVDSCSRARCTPHYGFDAEPVCLPSCPGQLDAQECDASHPDTLHCSGAAERAILPFGQSVPSGCPSTHFVRDLCPLMCGVCINTECVQGEAYRNGKRREGSSCSCSGGCERCALSVNDIANSLQATCSKCTAGLYLIDGVCVSPAVCITLGGRPTAPDIGKQETGLCSSTTDKIGFISTAPTTAETTKIEPTVTETRILETTLLRESTAPESPAETTASTLFGATTTPVSKSVQDTMNVCTGRKASSGTACKCATNCHMCRLISSTKYGPCTMCKNNHALLRGQCVSQETCKENYGRLSGQGRFGRECVVV